MILTRRGRLVAAIVRDIKGLARSPMAKQVVPIETRWRGRPWNRGMTERSNTPMPADTSAR